MSIHDPNTPEGREGYIATLERLVEDRDKVLAALECPAHGAGCVPGALWKIRKLVELCDAVDHMAARSKLGESIVEVPRSLYDAVIEARAAVDKAEPNMMTVEDALRIARSLPSRVPA